MGFFEKVGRKVEQFRQEAKRAADEEVKYACRDCEERFYTDREQCPKCGSENVAAIE